MPQLHLSVRTLRAMQIIRIAAWIGVALCVGIRLLQPEAGLAEGMAQQVFNTNANAPACGCERQAGHIS